MDNKRYYAGIDIGTSYIKTVVIDENEELVGSFVEATGPNLQKSINKALEGVIKSAKINKDNIKHITSTGFGRKNAAFADSVKTEISCHAKGAYHYFPKKITIIDIGGQDTEIIRIDEKGKIINFKMNRKCASGTGMFLEEIARRLDISINEMNALASKSDKKVALSSFCTVFASTEILSRIKEGEDVEDMVRSAFESVARRVIEMNTLDGTLIMTGGVVAYNTFILKALEQYVEKDIQTPPNPQLIGAIGAALFAKKAAKD